MSSTVGSLAYSYNNVNQLTGMQNSWGDIFGFTYNEHGRLGQILRPGSETSFSYTSNGLVQRVDHSAGGSLKSFAEYQFDQRNFPIQRTNSLGSSSFGYDQSGIYNYDNTAQRLLEDWQYYYVEGRGVRPRKFD